MNLSDFQNNNYNVTDIYMWNGETLNFSNFAPAKLTRFEYFQKVALSCIDQMDWTKNIANVFIFGVLIRNPSYHMKISGSNLCVRLGATFALSSSADK